jgi:methyl-accepting chemotaxis protein
MNINSLTIGKRIALGFTTILVILLILGAMALVSMQTVKTIATRIQIESVPAVDVANNVERNSLQTMYQMRGFAYTEETSFLDAANKELEKTKDFLKKAQELGASTPALASLKTAADSAEKSAIIYEGLVKETVTVTTALEKERVLAEEAAVNYMNACNAWIKLQDTRLAAAAQRGAKAEEILAIAKKATIANDIVDTGNAIIIGTWKSQFRRSPEIFNEAKAKFSKVDVKLDELRGLSPDAEETRQIDACAAAGAAYKGNMDRFLAGWLKREDIAKQRGTAADQVLNEAQSTAIAQLEATKTATKSAASGLQQSSTILLAGLIAALAIGIAIAFFISRSIVKVLSGTAASLSEGSDQVASASGQISSASQSLAEGASEQAASLEETSASLEEIASMTKRNAENALSAKDLSSETKQAAETGSANMQEMNRAMADIQSASGNISKIIKTIDEIAFQTNILALNAAVEAARAGQAGAGFAVVADEVRNLAQRSAQAAKETAEKIEDSIAKSANGVAISGKVTESLAQIVTKARQVDELVAEIATASREQSQGLDQVNTAVTQMDKVTQTNAATAEESASASEELSAQAATLREIVAELQKLVIGSGNVSAQSSSTRREIKHTQPYSPPARRQVPAKSADHRALNGSNGSRPALVSSNGRNPESEIPMDDGFKDF